MEYVYLYLMCGVIYAMFILSIDGKKEKIYNAIYDIKWDLPMFSFGFIQGLLLIIAVILWLPLFTRRVVKKITNRSDDA